MASTPHLSLDENPPLGGGLQYHFTAYQQTVLEAFGQVADMLDALSHDAEELSAQSEAQDAAQRNLELARMAYNEGNAGILQVLDAERLSQRARLGFVRAEGQRYIDTAQLFLALGGTTPDDSAARAARRSMACPIATEVRTGFVA